MIAEAKAREILQAIRTVIAATAAAQTAVGRAAIRSAIQVEILSAQCLREEDRRQYGGEPEGAP